jgi:rifampicin phosphotransferase
MLFITQDQPESATRYTTGGKAENLFRLKEYGFNIPDWIVIPLEILSDIFQYESIGRENKLESLAAEIVKYFGETDLFAVRSSAAGEDGDDLSYAGMFESYLYVTSAQLGEHIKKVWNSASAERVSSYRLSGKTDKGTGTAVIIQKMIDADIAGVGFGMNPADGNRKARVINAVYGLGEGLVSGELNADSYIISGNKITSAIAEKTHQFVFDKKHGSGTTKIPVHESALHNPVMDSDKIYAVVNILNRLATEYCRPMDIEFAFNEGTLYLLQARPVTNMNRIPDRNEQYILWDNSNIIESYPGVTTPLTFSFISRSYEDAYRMFAEFLGVDREVTKQNERVFANTLGLINGRVYYNLRSWYHMLAMLPGYSINARFMEKMMGVKERFDIPESYSLSKTAAWWRIGKMVVQMYLRYRALPEERVKFMNLVDQTISRYKKINFTEKSPGELMQLYLDFEKTLLNEWKAPLLNDFFAMIWFGMLQKQCVEYKISSNPNIHNDLLCGSSDIISVQPIHRSIEIATIIASDLNFRRLFISEDPYKIWKTLLLSSDPHFQKLKKEIDRYIDDFGERCIGELKLESISYTQEPAGFIRVLKGYIESGVTADKISGKSEELIRTRAEAELEASLKNNIIKKFRIKRTLKKARELVSARENLRYERTRAFGIVREIFTHLGKRLYAERIIASPRDIFYLTKEEIFAYIDGRSVTTDLKGLINLRKSESERFREGPVPAERFPTYGPVYHANDFFSLEKTEPISGDLKGTGCCPGRVKARIKVVTDPRELTSLNGDILITTSTDPGWVTLFPSASGIIVERGSLLSHSAIVSREMGIPCIVGVTGLLRTLKTGDFVEMDGGTGEIKILNKEFPSINFQTDVKQ